jgi:hypothetical protein
MGDDRLRLTPASQIKIRPMRPSPHELQPRIPEDQRILADGRATHSVLAAMINEWRDILGGNATLRGGPRWTYYSDDSLTMWGKRGTAQSAVLCALSDHASARALVSGYSGGILGNFGRLSYFCATALRRDGIAVALAALDLELTGSTALADWYLSTWCPSLGWHRHHSEEVDHLCGSATCGTAAPGTPCDCICGGVNHGMGPDTGKPGAAPALDWDTAPAPVWRLGTGTVEVEIDDEWAQHMDRKRVAPTTIADPAYLIRGADPHG